MQYIYFHSSIIMTYWWPKYLDIFVQGEEEIFLGFFS
jgi:hypothetical protein